MLRDGTSLPVPLSLPKINSPADTSTIDTPLASVISVGKGVCVGVNVFTGVMVYLGDATLGSLVVT